MKYFRNKYCQDFKRGYNAIHRNQTRKERI
nr:MAG TPA: hypothetical protein [Caudoviricetes sp.]